jgi:hypothetical protein
MADPLNITDPELVEKLNISGVFGGKTPDTEKPALKSKKFIAFLATQGGLFTLMAMMLHLQDVDKLGANAAFMTLAATAGFLAVGYILGQASLDRYVHLTKLTAKASAGAEDDE